MTEYGIEYTKPSVLVLQSSGIGVPEVAARTCYDSFDNSENESVKNLNTAIQNHEETATEYMTELMKSVNGIHESELLDSLSWVHHHHSILEHTTVSYLIKGTSRGVLQEHARHRIQAISVRSTRYTMSSVINAFCASLMLHKTSVSTAKVQFFLFFKNLDMLVVKDVDYIRIESDSIYDKLYLQYKKLGHDEFMKTGIAKSSLDFFKDMNIINLESIKELYDKLEAGKKKRNVGDAFKHIVSDNWKVDLVVTFNLRSLKNYFELRDSGAAFFQIQWLAKEMKKVTPRKYLKLIDKSAKDN